MSVDEFWNDDPDLFWAYRFSYYNKLKNKQEIFNGNAWLQGAYFLEAVSVALNNSFSESKIEYSKQPYGFDKKELTEEEKRKQLDIQVADVKARIKQIQAIKNNNHDEMIYGKDRCSTT